MILTAEPTLADIVQSQDPDALKVTYASIKKRRLRGKTSGESDTQNSSGHELVQLAQGRAYALYLICAVAFLLTGLADRILESFIDVAIVSVAFIGWQLVVRGLALANQLE